MVSEATGVSRRAIRVGTQELLKLKGSETETSLASGTRIRKPGGGRKRTVEKDPSLKDDLNALVDPITRGDPESPLRRTCKSVRKLAAELRSRGQPEEVRVHDFKIKELGRAAPFGIDDIGENAGWVGVGTDHDTAEFAVATIRNWWHSMGSPIYPRARRLLLTV